MPRLILLSLLLLLSGACEPQQETPPTRVPAAEAPGEPTEDPASVGELNIGQVIYVPAYSHIYFRDDRRTINLAVTLSIRNTDPTRPIVITSVRYYGSDGTLLRHYLDQPLRLAPMASKDYVLEERDTSGGSGANFIVEWAADEMVSQPVVEAVMISTASAQGISFLSTGRVIEERRAEASE